MIIGNIYSMSKRFQPLLGRICLDISWGEIWWWYLLSNVRGVRWRALRHLIVLYNSQLILEDSLTYATTQRVRFPSKVIFDASQTLEILSLASRTRQASRSYHIYNWKLCRFPSFIWLSDKRLWLKSKFGAPNPSYSSAQTPIGFQGIHVAHLVHYVAGGYW